MACRIADPFAEATRVFRIREHERELRNALVQQSLSCGTTQEEEKALVAALQMNKQCNLAAMWALYGADVPWSPYCLRNPPREDGVCAALRLVKLAQAVLEDAAVDRLLSRSVSTAATLTDETSANSIHLTRFAYVWPHVATLSNTATVHFVSGKSRRAMVASERAISLLASTTVPPDVLVYYALAATAGSLAVAKQLVVCIVSHACILRHSSIGVDANARARRLEAARCASQLGVTLASTLSDVGVARVAVSAAQERGLDKGEGVWPGLLQSRTPVALLLSFAYYNAAVIEADLLHQTRAHHLLRAALDHAVNAGAESRSFGDFLRAKLDEVTRVEHPAAPVYRRCSVSGSLRRRCTAEAPLATDLSLRCLCVADGSRRPGTRTALEGTVVARPCSSAAESWLDHGD